MKKTKVFYLAVFFAVSVLLMSTANARAVSEEARRHIARGQAAMEMAKSPAELEDAINEFQEAARLAPSWPDPYYNLGIAQEKSGKLREAVASFKRYLQLAPNAPNAAKIQEQIYKLEYKAEQTITDEVALDIFGSLGNENMWQEKCEGEWGSEVAFSGRDGQQIKITYNRDRNNTTIVTERVTPNGKTLTFNYMYLWCDRSIKADQCPVRGSVSMEIISKSLVRMFVKREVGSTKYWSASVQNYSCDLVRK